jgi:GT2 family glycosyltransferase
MHGLTGRALLNPTLSVIVATYNPDSILLDCLASISAGIGEIPVEIIIVDNGSQDGVIEQVSQSHSDIRIIRNGDNRGFAAANNQGLRVASGQYLALVNPDVIVEPDALKRLISLMEGCPEVSIVGPRTLNAQGEVAATAHGAYTPWHILQQFFGLSTILAHFRKGRSPHTAPDGSSPLEVTWIQASCMLFRRTVYEDIGGLDEQFFLFCEEPDFCERAARAGWRTFYFPQATIRHLESTTVSRYPLLKMRHYHLSPLHYFRKRAKQEAVNLLKVGFILELAIKWMVRLLQYRIRPSSSLKDKIAAYPVVIKDVWQY